MVSCFIFGHVLYESLRTNTRDVDARLHRRRDF